MDARVFYLAAASFVVGFAPYESAHAEESGRERTLTWHAEPSADVARDSTENAQRPEHGATEAIDDGQLQPFTMGATTPRAHVVAQTLAGYDSTTKSVRARSAVEAPVTKFLVLQADFEHAPSTGSDENVGFGARVQVLNQAAHGLDAAVGFGYDPKDFRSEGNFVGSPLVGHRFGRVGLFGNALFGMDTEGDDQSIELRLGSNYRVTPYFEVGVDARGRMNMSIDSKRFGAQSVDWEAQGGPVASFSVGPLALLAIAGPSLLELTLPGTGTELRTGVQALAGAGAAF